MRDKLLAGLTPRQIVIVAAVFMVSLIAAILVAMWFRRQNRRSENV